MSRIVTTHDRTKRPLILLVALPLTGCGAGDGSAQSECARQANQDPKVVEIYTRTNGAYTLGAFEWGFPDELKAAKRAAVLRCMREKGLAPPGGVELVQPR
jgi:hypothetical protein